MKINNEVQHYFQSAKWVRQGDPLSPLLFIMAREVLTKMILEAKKGSLLVGLAPDLVESSVVVLQYVDDTVI